MPPKRNKKRKQDSNDDEMIKRGKRKITQNDLKDIKEMIKLAGFQLTYQEIQQRLEEDTLMSYIRQTDPSKRLFWDLLEAKIKTIQGQEQSANSTPITRSQTDASTISEITEHEVVMDINEVASNDPIPILMPSVKQEVSTESTPLRRSNTPEAEVLLIDSEDEEHRGKNDRENHALQQNQTNSLGSRARDSISVTQEMRRQGRARAVAFREEDPPITRTEYREMMSTMTDVLRSIQRLLDAVETLTRATTNRLEVQPTAHVTINQPLHHVPPFIQPQVTASPPRTYQVSDQRPSLSSATVNYVPVRPQARIATFHSTCSTISNPGSLSGNSETAGSSSDNGVTNQQ